MKRKNILLSLGTLGAIAAPISLVVSCGKNEPKDNINKVLASAAEINKSALKLSDLPKDGTTWIHGIGYHAFSQTTQMLFNLAIKLGWTLPSDKTAVTVKTSESLSDEQKNKIALYKKFIDSFKTIDPSKSIGDNANDPERLNNPGMELDVVGADGTTGNDRLESGIYGIHHDRFAKDNNLAYSGGGNYVLTSDDKKTTIHVVSKHHSQLVEADNPGIIKTKIWFEIADDDDLTKLLNDEGKATKTISSPSNYIPKYNIVSNDDLKKYVAYSHDMINKLKEWSNDSNFGSTMTLAASYMTPDFKDAITYLYTKDYTNTDLTQELTSLNTGAFYLPAISVFSSGINLDDDDALKPIVGDKPQDISFGFSKMKSLMGILLWIHGTKYKNNAVTPYVAQ